MGIVFLARDVALDRPVAIKLLPPEMAADAGLRERFLREARTAAQLSHPNIVPIHLVEERDGSIYFVMALVDGESLGERIRRGGPLPTSEVVRILQEVAWALAYAHGRGVVHRDIKPDNILLERGSGRALITDFGIARTANAAPSGTTPGMILGSLQYIAPEQADGTVSVDGRADLYSLGVTAFYALTGRLPFESTAGAKLLAAHLLEPAPPLATISPTIPPRLAEIVDHALLKDPADRWQSGEALADALGLLNQAPRAMPPSIRRFVMAVHSAAGQLMLLALVLTWSSLLVPDQFSFVWKLLAIIAVAPGFTIIESARAVAVAGYGVDDVVAATRAERSGSDGYTQYVKRSAAKSQALLTKGWGRLIVGGFGAIEIIAGLGIIFDRPTVFAWWKLALSLGIGGLAAWIGVECLGFALRIGPFRNRVTRFIERQELRNRDISDYLWRSWPIHAALAIGRSLLWTMPGARAALPRRAAEAKPTEAILAAAAEELLAGLSASDRAAAAAVPSAVRNLQRAAAELRRKQQALDESLASIGDVAGNERRAALLSQMQQERAVVSDRLRSTVEAMENLRLDLLKLRAGLGNPDELTAAIEAAQRVGEGIAYTLQGRAEASKIA